MSETPKRKPPKLGPKKADAAPAQTSTQKTAATPKKATNSTTKTTTSKPKPTASKPATKTPNPEAAKTPAKEPPKKLPAKKPAQETSAETRKKQPAKSTPKADPENSTAQSEPKKRAPKLPPKQANDEPPTDKPEEKRKPPKLGPKKDASQSSTPARKPSAAPTATTQSRRTSAAPTTTTQASRRPSAMPRQSSQAAAKKQAQDAGLDTPAQKVGEQQDLKSALSEEQRIDLIQLVGSITGQMRQTIEDNFDASATLKSFAQADRSNMTEDEKINAPIDIGNMDLSQNEKEKKLRDEREKELSSPKVKQLKKTALEWFDEWQKVVQNRVKEQIGPDNKSLKGQEEKRSTPSKPELRPVQRVNTDAKTGEYSPPKMEELFPRLKTSLTKLSLKERQLVLHSMLLLMLSLEHYNAASRVLLLYLASSLKLGLKHLREDEEHTAQGLLKAAKQITADEEALKKKKLEGQEAHKWRVRLATAAGAAVVGVSGGLAAPMIAAGVGSVMGGLGLEATAAAGYLGSVAGSTYLVGGLFGAYGGRMTGDMMKELSAEVEDFAFLPVHGERKDHGESVDAATESRRLRVVIAVSGWLLEKEEVVTPWKVLKPSAEVFALRFELEALMNLGQSIDTMISSAAYGYAQSAMIKQTVFADLMSAMWPVALVKVARVVDNPFTLAKTRADKAGKVLAEALINRTQGERPVTLIGYSLGARVIWSCLTTLAEKKAFGLVESAVLMGSPLPSDVSTWRTMRTAVSGRLVNVYSENDYLLAFLYRTSSLQLGVAGIMPISGLYNVENVDVSETVSGHLRYRYLVGSILQKIGFEDIDKGEVDKEAEAFKKVVEEESKNGYLQQAKDGYHGKKTGQAPKRQPKTISDAEADKQASAMEKEVAAKTKKGLMQWAVEQLYISPPSAPSTGDAKNAAADPKGATEGIAKDTAKTADKTIDAATKTLYQRAKDAIYLSRSGGAEGEKMAQEKLSQAQETAPTGYLATAAGYIPTSYIPGLGGTGSAKKSAPKAPTDTPKPPLKKMGSTQKKAGDAAKPALKKTDSMQKKVGDTSKDPTKAAGDAAKSAGDTAKDPSKAVDDTGKQAKDAGKSVTDAATSAGKAGGDVAKEPSKAVDDAGKQAKDTGKSVTDTAASAGKAGGDAAKEAPKAATEAAKDPAKAAGDASKTATDSASGAGEKTGEAAKKTAGGVSSYMPSFGFGKSKGAVPGMAAAGIKPRQSNIDSLLAGAEESSKKETKAPEKKAPASGKKRISEASRKPKETTDSAKKSSGGYSSYIPSFGFGGSKTPSKDAPKPEKATKEATNKTENAANDAQKAASEKPEKAKDTIDDSQKTVSEGTDKAKDTADNAAFEATKTPSKAKDTGEDIFTSPPAKGSNSLANAASSAGKSATNAAGSAGKTVSDSATGAQKYTPKMGGLGGDAGDKVGEMAGGAASGAKSGVSAVGSGAKSGVSALGGAGKGLAGLASGGSKTEEKKEEEEAADEDKEGESDDVSEADSEETERPSKVTESGSPSTDEDDDDGSAGEAGNGSGTLGKSGSEDGEGESHYDTAKEEAEAEEESMQVGSPDPEPEEKKEEKEKEKGGKEEAKKGQEAKEKEEEKGYASKVGGAASGAGSSVVSGAGSVGKGAASGASTVGKGAASGASAVGGAAASGVGRLGRGFGWGKG